MGEVKVNQGICQGSAGESVRVHQHADCNGSNALKFTAACQPSMAEVSQSLLVVTRGSARVDQEVEQPFHDWVSHESGFITGQPISPESAQVSHGSIQGSTGD